MGTSGCLDPTVRQKCLGLSECFGVLRSGCDWSLRRPLVCRGFFRDSLALPHFSADPTKTRVKRQWSQCNLGYQQERYPWVSSVEDGNAPSTIPKPHRFAGWTFRIAATRADNRKAIPTRAKDRLTFWDMVKCRMPRLQCMSNVPKVQLFCYRPFPPVPNQNPDIIGFADDSGDRKSRNCSMNINPV